MAQLRSETTML